MKKNNNIKIHSLLFDSIDSLKTQKNEQSFHIDLLPSCGVILYLERNTLIDTIDVGDHDLIICNIRDTFSLIDESNNNLISLENQAHNKMKPLTTSILRNEKIIE